MIRFGKDHAARVASEFAASSAARTWFMFGAEIHNAIIDAVVMRELRWSHVADSTQVFTATQIIGFRDAVVACLAAGVVPAHSRGPRFRVTIDD